MSKKYLFLGRRKEDDRDCCIYISTDSGEFACGHYFSGIHFSGACYSGLNTQEILNDVKNEMIETVLNNEDMNELLEIDKALDELSFGIEVNSDKYNKGLECQARIKKWFEKLETDKANNLFKKIIEEEKEYCMEQYNLTEEEVDEIFENYNLDYQDRGIINCIFEDKEELGREMFDVYYNSSNDISKYIDYESFADDLLEDEVYYELNDGRIVSYSY